MNAPDETPAEQIGDVDSAWKWDPDSQTWVPSTPPPTTPPEPPAAVAGDAVAGAPAAPPPPAPAPVDVPPAPSPAQVQTPAQPKVMPQDWPCAGYSGPQPWEADNPPALTQNHLMVSSGSAGEEVVELAALLAHLGFGTSISAGQNPHAIYDTGVSDAMRAFCEAYGVAEDPQVLQARTPDTVGPWLWEALTRAVHKKLAGAEA